jgi:cyclopropane fatty-acyl-phospholipid synthase-like methyltransferase
MINIFRKKIKETEKLSKFSIYNTFLSRPYQEHNIARLKHLESLGLNISNKSVLEIGAGIGDHTFYYLIKNCNVISTDARPELVEFIKDRFNNTAFTLDAETELAKLESLPVVDIIHCYGLLYHISNPEEFLRSLKSRCHTLFLETCVSHDFRQDGPYVTDENSNNPTQAKSGKGCRPTRGWIYSILKETFPYVYMPVTQPDHQEFPSDWSAPMEDRSKLIRSVFCASTEPIKNPLLSESFVKTYR